MSWQEVHTSLRLMSNLTWHRLLLILITVFSHLNLLITVSQNSLSSCKQGIGWLLTKPISLCFPFSLRSYHICLCIFVFVHSLILKSSIYIVPVDEPFWSCDQSATSNPNTNMKPQQHQTTTRFHLFQTKQWSEETRARKWKSSKKNKKGTYQYKHSKTTKKSRDSIPDPCFTHFFLLGFRWSNGSVQKRFQGRDSWEQTYSGNLQEQIVQSMPTKT